MSGVDLAQWLGAQLDADERIARAATAGPWRAHDTHLGQYGYAATILSGDGNDTDLRAWLPSMSNEPWDEARNVWADAAFIAEHDPARVLREIDAKREVVKQYERAFENRRAHPDDLASAGALLALHGAVKALALAYSHRPGYTEAIDG